MSIAQFPISVAMHFSANLSEVAPRQVIQPPSMAADGAILISSGLAWVYNFGDRGQLRAVALRYAGEAILPDELGLGFGVQALTRCRFARCSAAEFDNLLSPDRESRGALIGMFARHHRIALMWLLRSTFDAQSRLAHLLFEVAARSGQATDAKTLFQLPLTQTDLSSLTGQTNVNVNRLMRAWERDGVIARRSPKLLMVDWPELNRFAKFNGHYLH